VVDVDHDVATTDGARRGHRCALYLRVSTVGQTIENQRPDLERVVATRGLRIVATYEEHASAVKKRPAFDAMMAAAHRGAFDVLGVWALDRFGRSMVGNVQAVLDLERSGVRVLSVREPWTDASGPVRDLLVAVFGWVAEQERARLIERTKAGLERARREGKRIGRPPRAFDLATAWRLRDEGASLRTIAMKLHVPRATLGRALCRRDT
jgi:DNA invertase Pin-like site-specific DNA recombinase